MHHGIISTYRGRLLGVMGCEGSFNSPIQVLSNMDSNNVGVAFIF